MSKKTLFTVEQDPVTKNYRAKWLLPWEDAESQWFHERSLLGPLTEEAAKQDVLHVVPDAVYVVPEQLKREPAGELKPLNIVDDRTIEQVREDGDDRLPSGEPYILRGVCCVCGSKVAQEVENGYPVHVCLIQLDTPVPCELHLLVQEEQKCTGLAHWASGAIELYAECDECILNCAERLPDNRKWLEPALADIQARREEQPQPTNDDLFHIDTIPDHSDSSEHAWWYPEAPQPTNA